MRSRCTVLTLMCLCLLLQGCAPFLLPKAHRHPMQQGNLIDPDQRNQLQAGMNRDQVRYLIGEPTMANLAEPDTWLYLYNSGVLLEPGINHLLALRFDGSGTLVDIDNRYAPEAAQRAFRQDTRSDFD